MSVDIDSPSCPICGGRAFGQPEHPEVSLYRCADCKHCFTDPASIEVLEAYAPEYFTDVHRNWFESPNIALFDIIRTEAGAHTSAPSVIDVGCGKGDLLRYLHRSEPGWRLVGVDLSPNEPTPGIDFIQGDVFDLSPDRSYDVVTNLLVIEHIADVNSFVGTLTKLCCPGGLLIVTTNDEQSLLYGAARLLRRWGYSAAYDRLYSRHHLNHFSVPTLRLLLEQHGLRVIKTLHHNIPLSAVDLPPAGVLTQTAWRAGVCTAFAVGAAMRRTFLQTVVCTLPA
jgi:SAM-dependent methyltransferase